MASETPRARTKLTFSQAEGLAPLPSQLRLGELSPEFRSLLWAHLVDQFERTATRGQGFGSIDRLGAPWRKVLRDAHVILYHRPVDEFESGLKYAMQDYKHLVWHGEYNEIFDLIQFKMRHPDCPYHFASEVRSILRRSRAAYTVIDLDSPSIIPIGSAEEVNTLIGAFTATKHEAFPGARTHLRLAVEALNGGRFADSVRESVHAVESAARVLSKDASATLTPALQELEKRISMHAAFKRALSQLYGYSSNEGGIRHSLLEDEAHVDMHDALFMLGACASFVTFLIGKARAAGMISE